MDTIVRLLKEKNHFLEKFFSLNERELKKYVEGNFDDLEYFYETRDKLLNIISFIDAKVDKANSALGASPTISAEQRHSLRTELAIKDRYADLIVKSDMEILSTIEAAKSRIIQELQEIKKGKKAISGYKSPSQHRRLNEEA